MFFLGGDFVVPPTAERYRYMPKNPPSRAQLASAQELLDEERDWTLIHEEMILALYRVVPK